MHWLRIIGEQSSSVRAIQLDISGSLEYDTDFDVLQILKYVWKPEHKSMAVYFVTPPERLPMGFSEWCANDTIKVNKGMSALIADPSKLLRKYSRIPSMLSRVDLNRNGSKVYVSYRQNHRGRSNWMEESRITISDEGELCMVPPDREIGFHELMSIRSIKDALMELVHPSGVMPVFDLTNQTMTINMKGLAGVNDYLRRKVIWEVSDYHSTFKSTTSTPKYDFTTEIERFSAIRLRGCPRYFHLYFDLSKDFTLDDVRFDALPLLFAMSSVEMSIPDRDLHLKIEVRHSLNPQTPNQTFTLLLSELKTGILYFIYKFLETYPERANLPCPSVWTNGWGQVKEATWKDELTLGPVDNPYLDNSHGVVRLVGNALADDWASKVGRRVTPVVEGTLFEFLKEVSWW